MTALPFGSGGSPAWEIPDHGVGDEGVDVLSLAGQPAPAGGAWLWVTAAEPRRGGEFTALVLPAHRPAACGGDVLVHVSPAGEPGSGTTAAKVQVWAVVAGSLVRVAAWDPAGPDLWPETVRETVTFAMGALTELEQHGADLSARQQVDVTAAAGSVPAAFPSLPTQVSLGGQPRARGTRARAPAGARPFPSRRRVRAVGRRRGPDTATTGTAAVPARRRCHAPARARCRADRAVSCDGPRAVVGHRPDGGGTDQQPERGGGLLGDDAVVMDSSLSQGVSYLSPAAS